MIITEFERNNTRWREQLADLLRLNWPEAYSETAEEEVDALLSNDRIAVAAISADDELIGFIGATPQYQKTGWELHPLVVAESFQRNRIGTRLINFLEKEVVAEGGLVLYLGTDDENHETTLSEGDLFQDTFKKIEQIKAYQNHPYQFYQKQGYQIVGVIPDANGWQKPDIWMAKRLVEQSTDESK